jgi:hypothetical protein
MSQITDPHLTGATDKAKLAEEKPKPQVDKARLMASQEEKKKAIEKNQIVTK